jgi:pyruvate kinase
MPLTALQAPRSRTKVVATLGPTSCTLEAIKALALAGANVFRVNFSHGSHEGHSEVIRLIRQVSEIIGRPLAILGDLSGPKLRLGDVPGGAVEIEHGGTVVLTSGEVSGDTSRFHVRIPDLHAVIQPGRLILLDDGLVRLRVTEVRGQDVVCRAETACVIKSRKGVNLPGTHLPIPAMTEKDHEDLKFAIKAGVDLVALSFVRSPEDVALCKNAIAEYGGAMPVIAKIEKSEALDELGAILDLADGAMVARGDLGVEIPIEEVPSAQSRIIRACNARTIPVITATQMLNSMIENPTPTRAEVTDIYNAILTGTDAVMLSGETASGRFPLESVEMMVKVARQAEEDMEWSRSLGWHMEPGEESPEVAEAICQAAVHLASQVKVDAIICPTTSGATALRIARFRPRCQVLAFSTKQATVNRLCLAWGVEARPMRELWGTEEESGESDALINVVVKEGKEAGLLRHGMTAIVVAGVPLRQPGRTNFLRVIEIKDDWASPPPTSTFLY